MSDELLPCPFCGNDVNDDEGCFRSGEYYEVRCGNPTCFAHDPCADGRTSAVDRWNRRVAQPQYRDPTLEDAWELVDSYILAKGIKLNTCMLNALKQLGFVRKVQP